MSHRTSRIGALVALGGLIAACSPGSSSGGSVAPTSSAGTSVAAPSAAASAVASHATHDILGDFDIGSGRTLHLICVGPTDTGKPTAILEAGLTGSVDVWGDVLSDIQATTRTCAYDRAGEGQSPPATVGRTVKDQVGDLHALLAAAKIPPPYVLVGHSSGGWNVLVYADVYPGEVAGAVLVDARPPTASARWLAALPPQTATESEAIKGARDESTTFDTDPSQNPEGLDLRKSEAQAAAAKGFGDKPLIVLVASDTRVITDGFEPALATKFLDIWLELQDGLVKLSAQGILKTVSDTDHMIPEMRPDAVIDAIRTVTGS